jgi:hypothetical protein
MLRSSRAHRWDAWNARDPETTVGVEVEAHVEKKSKSEATVFRCRRCVEHGRESPGE